MLEDAIPVNDVVDDLPLSPGETTPPPLEENASADCNKSHEKNEADDSIPSVKMETTLATGYYIHKDAMIVPGSTLTRHATPLPNEMINADKVEMTSTLDAIHEAAGELDEQKTEENHSLEAILLNTPYGGKKGQAIAQALEFSSAIAEEPNEGVELFTGDKSLFTG